MILANEMWKKVFCDICGEGLCHESPLMKGVWEESLWLCAAVAVSAWVSGIAAATLDLWRSPSPEEL